MSEKNWYKCTACNTIMYTDEEATNHKCRMPSPVLERGGYKFEEQNNFHQTSKIYRDVKFRPDIKLTMEADTFIGDNCVILVPELIMKAGSQICAGTVLAGRERVVLNEHSVVGYSCVLLTSTDSPEGKMMNDASPEEARKIVTGEIVLKPYSYVGSNVTIMPGVTVGSWSVVGCNTYLYFDVDKFTIIYPKQELEKKSRDEYWK